MRRFTVPFDLINVEDKVIGGYVSLRQFFWLMVPTIYLIMSFTVFKGYLIETGGIIHVSALGVGFRIISSLILLILGVFMAFFKFDNMNADKYLLKSIKYKFRKKYIKFNE